MLTTDQIRTEVQRSTSLRNRTVSCLVEARRQLEREMSYSPDLRQQTTLDFLNGHIAKLEAVLS